MRGSSGTGAAWARADAAITEELDAVYLPAQTLDDESAAFGRALMVMVQPALERITVTPLP